MKNERTVMYMPPESCGERTGWQLKCGDMWAIGVIGYILVIGKAPFCGESNAQTVAKVVNDKLKFPKGIELTSTCIDFISRLLEKDCNKRLTAKQALEHPWLADRKSSKKDLGGMFRSNMQNFHDTGM